MNENINMQIQLCKNQFASSKPGLHTLKKKYTFM